MSNLIKTQFFGIIALIVVVLVAFGGGNDQVVGTTAVTKFTNPVSFDGGLTTGGGCKTLTDANGGTYTLTQAELIENSCFEFAAGGAGQAVIALTMPATSTMTSLIPNAGECRSWTYSAANLAAATTTTITAGTGHNILAYTTNDDVIDGLERAQITMCRTSSTDVDTYTTEILNAD